MKLAFYTVSMNDQPLADLVARIAGAGYDGVELYAYKEGHCEPTGCDARRRGEIRQIVADAGLEISALHVGSGLTRKTAWNDEDMADYFRRVCDMAADVGAPCINYLTYADGDLGDQGAWKLLIDRMAVVGPYAEERGVALTLENHEGTTMDAPEKVRLLAEWVRSPAMKTNFDAANYHILGVNLPAAVAMLGHLIRHVHLKGVVGRYPQAKFLYPGQDGDELPFRDLAAALAGIGYDGFISVETFAWQDPQRIEKAYQVLAPQLAEMGLRETRS